MHKKFLLLLVGLMLVACGGGNVKADKSLEQERRETMRSLASQVENGLTKLDKDIKEAYVWNLKQVKAGIKGNKEVASEAQLKLELVKKIRPVESLKMNAMGLRSEAEEVKDAALAKIAYPSNPEYETFKTKMGEAVAKIKEGDQALTQATKEFQAEFKNLKTHK